MKDFTTPGKISFICDGQFGSTGKGLAASYLATLNRASLAVTNASANAGHTWKYNGKKGVTHHLPTWSVIDKATLAYICAGAIVDPGLLIKELESNEVDASMVLVSSRAAIISEHHKHAEMNENSSNTKLASTRKGVGEALASKIKREEGSIAFYSKMLQDSGVTVCNFNITGALEKGAAVVCEVPQGFSLGINHGLAFPYCTSRECTILQAMSDMGVHPHYLGNTMMVVRTYPIRVGNIVNEDGVVIGDSGPCYPDQNETTFEALGVEPELTTVTKRVRRIFTWSKKQYELACSINRPNCTMLTFCDYITDGAYLLDILDHADSIGFPVTHISFGGDVMDVVDIREFNNKHVVDIAMDVASNIRVARKCGRVQQHAMVMFCKLLNNEPLQ